MCAWRLVWWSRALYEQNAKLEGKYSYRRSHCHQCRIQFAAKSQRILGYSSSSVMLGLSGLASMRFQCQVVRCRPVSHLYVHLRNLLIFSIVPQLLSVFKNPDSQHIWTLINRIKRGNTHSARLSLFTPTRLIYKAIVRKAKTSACRLIIEQFAFSEFTYNCVRINTQFWRVRSSHTSIHHEIQNLIFGLATGEVAVWYYVWLQKLFHHESSVTTFWEPCKEAN